MTKKIGFYDSSDALDCRSNIHFDALAEKHVFYDGLGASENLQKSPWGNLGEKIVFYHSFDALECRSNLPCGVLTEKYVFYDGFGSD